MISNVFSIVYRLPLLWSPFSPFPLSIYIFPYPLLHVSFLVYFYLFFSFWHAIIFFRFSFFISVSIICIRPLHSILLNYTIYFFRLLNARPPALFLSACLPVSFLSLLHTWSSLLGFWLFECWTYVGLYVYFDPFFTFRSWIKGKYTYTFSCIDAFWTFCSRVLLESWLTGGDEVSSTKR